IARDSTSAGGRSPEPRASAGPRPSPSRISPSPPTGVLEPSVPTMRGRASPHDFADTYWLVGARGMRQRVLEILAWSGRGYSQGPGNDKRKATPPYFAIRSGQPSVARFTGDLWRRLYFSAGPRALSTGRHT